MFERNVHFCLILALAASPVFGVAALAQNNAAINGQLEWDKAVKENRDRNSIIYTGKPLQESPFTAPPGSVDWHPPTPSSGGVVPSIVPPGGVPETISHNPVIMDQTSVNVKTLGPNGQAQIHSVTWSYLRGTGPYLTESQQSTQQPFRSEIGIRGLNGTISEPGSPVRDVTECSDPIIWMTGTYDREGPSQAYLLPTNFRTESGQIIQYSGRIPLAEQY